MLAFLYCDTNQEHEWHGKDAKIWIWIHRIFFILVMIMHGFPVGFVSGFFPYLLISLSVLYYGQELIKDKNQNMD
jgi:hypothetical protein